LAAFTAKTALFRTTLISRSSPDPHIAADAQKASVI